MIWAVIIPVALLIWFTTIVEIAYSAKRRVVRLPSGEKIEVLLHREGVFLETRGEALANLYTAIPMMVKIVRHRLRNRGKAWVWAVTVRGVSLWARPLLIHEVHLDRGDAQASADRLIHLIEDGHQPWAEAASASDDT